MSEEHLHRRSTFDAAALRYDRARPGYPSALFDDVVALSAIRPGGRILEIGCGTGQATLPFARRGYHIVCVELGAHLAAVARHNLAAFPDVEVRVGTFEETPLAPVSFDLAIAASSFHWLDPAVALPKIAAALKPGGAIALFWNVHVWSEASAPFFEAVQAIYRRETPELDRDWRPLPRPEEVATPVAQQIEETGLFGPVTVRRYPWEETYDAEGYVELLGTYSDHLRQAPAARERLFRGIAELINTRFGGEISKGYLVVLYVAHRV